MLFNKETVQRKKISVLCWFKVYEWTKTQNTALNYMMSIQVICQNLREHYRCSSATSSKCHLFSHLGIIIQSGCGGSLCFVPTTDESLVKVVRPPMTSVVADENRRST